ncbi:ABC transporter substrate-binding protein [Microlunatus ginsengisoli]|uniref:ABC transporter substrate-binding protein n=1 Tax=Microlunatus ginsengisoli TaxID=363863 RepID=A0ABP7AVM0_9ACTN
MTAPFSSFSRRAFLGLGAAAVSAAALGACGAGGPAPSGSGSGGAGALTVLCEAGGQAELTPVADAFSKETGTKVTFVALPYEGLYNRFNTELSAGTPSFDVAAMDAIWLPTFAGKLSPLDDLFTDEVKADLFPSLVTGAQIDGKYVGMPVWANAEILFYREDLFSDSKEKAAFESKYGYELAAPTTWQQFNDVAQFFTRGTELYGTDVKGAVETEWLAHVVQAGAAGTVLDPSGKVIIDDAAHLSALTFYSDLANKLKVAPAGAAQVDWAAAQNLFNQGKTAMTRFWAHAYRQIPKDASVYGKVGVAPMIGGTAGVGAIPGPWYLSLPSEGKQSELATKFVQYAYDHNELSIQSDLGLAARISAFKAYQDKDGYESFKPLIATLDGPATKARPLTPKWQQIVDTVLVPTIQSSLKPGADYQALLTQARGKVESLVG